MAQAPKIESAKLWARRLKRCHEIICRALEILKNQTDHPDNEVDLNKKFYFCLLVATRELYPDEDCAPASECNNQPDPDDLSRAARDNKRPDFQWLFLDRYEDDPNRSAKQIVVECKRLGPPTSANWVLNVNYVKNGVTRFLDRNWAYGQRFAEGFMVGYVKDMPESEVLDEVNREILAIGAKALSPLATNLIGQTSYYHTLQRPFPISPFRLLHLWIQLN